MNITGQLKTFIDRTFGRYREMKDKEFFYIAACADPEEPFFMFPFEKASGRISITATRTRKRSGKNAKQGCDIKHSPYPCFQSFILIA